MGREQTKRVWWDKWEDKKKTEQRERKKKEKGVLRFSLRSAEIRPSVFVGARGKVHLRDESVYLFLYRPKPPQIHIVTRALNFSCTHVTLDKFA